MNFAIENLVLVSRRELRCLNQKAMIFNNPEMTKTGLNIAKLIIAKQKRKVDSKS